MEKYGDLITNGLDLLSFLLVTPELVKAVVPTAAWMVKLVIMLLVVFVVILLAELPAYLVVWWLLGGNFGEPNVPHWLVEVLNAVGGLLGLSLGFKLADRLNRHVAKHFLAVGVVLFLISRLIAFYGSAVKAGLLL